MSKVKETFIAKLLSSIGEAITYKIAEGRGGLFGTWLTENKSEWTLPDEIPNKSV